jgi:hypothetical protein
MKLSFPVILMACSSFISLMILANPSHALLKIEPSTRDFSIFSSPVEFNVSIGVSGINNVFGIQFDLRYNDSVLEFVRVYEGPFLNRSGQDRTFCLNPVTSAPGLVDDFACSKIGTTSTNGSGTVANLTFRIKPLTSLPGISNLNLSGVKVSDINSQPLDNSYLSGIVKVYECIPPETRSCVINGCQGTKICSNNQWGQCNVSIQPEICDGLDNDCDGQIDEGLSRLCSTNHLGICASGTETCSAGTWVGCPIPQTEVCDNSIDESCDGMDPLCAGDTNSDRCVDILDLSLVGRNFGLSSGFDVRADINKDGQIDIFDLVSVGRDFGRGSKSGC